MRLRKEESLLQKISSCLAELLKKGEDGQPVRHIKGRKRERGQVELLAGVFFLLLSVLILCTMLQLDIFLASAQYMEDALAASNLASAIIDVEEYGISHNIVIKDPLEAYEIYRYALKNNLNLDDSWQSNNKKLISGRVDISEYIVYNCVGEQVFVYEVGGRADTAEWSAAKGSVWAPNGVRVENTSIYSEIAYPVEGFLGICTEAKKGKLVDIVLNDSIEM